jgi:uncharacterized protein
MNLSLGEFHRFQGGAESFLYMVGSGGIVALDEVSDSVLRKLESVSLSADDLVDQLVQEGHSKDDARGSVRELWQLGALSDGTKKPVVSQPLPVDFPLQSIVLNITNQCNLSCSYCYEFGEDKIATPEGKPKFMDWEISKASIDYLFDSAKTRDAVHVTFFGGETLMNFHMLQRVVDYARGLAKERGMKVGFSLTTNATLLTTKIIDYLAENEVGVTVSIDGPQEMQDKFRIFANGKGSYDIIRPKIQELIARHRTRPIAARVTLTSGANDVLKIYQHLKHELNFHEVAFAPVTTSPNRLYSIGEPGMDNVLEQFTMLAQDYLKAALRGEHHGFSNVSDTLAELHQGVNKSLPCGAGLGMVGVGPSGDIAPCHRFVDSDEHVIGNIATGIDHEKRNEFLKKGSIDGKYDCHNCFARPLCAGGCHHEAFVRYGDSGHANLHYCDWIRGWTHTCLSIYGAIAAQNPTFLEHFSERKAS